MRAALFMLVALFALGSCTDKPSAGDCDKLLDHVLELELAKAGGTASRKDDLDFEAQKKKVREYVEDDFMDHCLNETPKPQIDCALKAKTLGQLAECDKT